MTKLKMLLDEVNVTYSERRFSSDGGVAELGLDLFVSTRTSERYVTLTPSPCCSPRTAMQGSTSYPCMKAMPEMHCVRYVYTPITA